MKFPSKEDILDLNLRHIAETGGDWLGIDNVRNSESLEWVLDAIRYPLFDSEIYPSIEQKAAILAWIIIDGHIFFDGCKRTGMSAMEIFLIINGYKLDASGDEIRNIALKIGRRVEENYSIEEFTDWVRSKIQQNNILYFSSIAYGNESISTAI